MENIKNLETMRILLTDISIVLIVMAGICFSVAVYYNNKVDKHIESLKDTDIEITK